MNKIQLIIKVVNADEDEVSKIWNLNGVRHRKNAPAIIEKECTIFVEYGNMIQAVYFDGEKVFYKDGKYSHRVLSNGETIYRRTK